MPQLNDVVWSQSGFEDLKKLFCKNNEFLRDAALLFFERSKLEQAFAEGLVKLAAKAKKICGENGTLKTSWEELAKQTEEEADIHRLVSTNLMEDIFKPLKLFADNQKEARKAAELVVDKAAKSYSEKHLKEVQSKKNAYLKSKESESLTTQAENSRDKTVSEKELLKLDQKCKKAEESVLKADDEYIARFIEAERAQLALDSSISSSVKLFEKIEDERIDYLKKTLLQYSSMLSETVPKYQQSYKQIEDCINRINKLEDMQLLCENHGTKRLPAEQSLFTCYEDDFTNTMNNIRRKMALESKVSKLARLLVAERNSIKGLSRLNSVYEDTPSYSTESVQQNIMLQFNQIKSMINLLEASIYRLNVSLSKVTQMPPPAHKLSSFIMDSKDKQGIGNSILCVPIDFGNNDNYEEENVYETAISHISVYDTLNRYESDDEDFDPDFDDVDSDVCDGQESQPHVQREKVICVADFDYTAAAVDELTIRRGDRISILVQHDDGWWKGESRGKQGLFPATYVHELKSKK
ncbi:nostrin isoform X2 [Hydra vulgaris]|uniref:Nostrin isoform X2 n=1 Tax=Hydra vulgaris TaxID=6087 RepID=A0ABM4CVG4_HYDVU